MTLQLGRFPISRNMGLAIQSIPMPSDSKIVGLEFDERNQSLQLLILQGEGVFNYTHRQFVIWGRGDWVRFTNDTKDVSIVGTFQDKDRTYTVAEVIE